MIIQEDKEVQTDVKALVFKGLEAGEWKIVYQTWYKRDPRDKGWVNREKKPFHETRSGHNIAAIWRRLETYIQVLWFWTL